MDWGSATEDVPSAKREPLRGRYIMRPAKKLRMMAPAQIAYLFME